MRNKTKCIINSHGVEMLFKWLNQIEGPLKLQITYLYLSYLRTLLNALVYLR